MIAVGEAAKMPDDPARCQAAAIRKWHSAPAKSGNEAFFQLGVDLCSAGLSTAEIEDVLRLETGNARHPAERRRDIKRIIKKLRASCGGWLSDSRRTSREARGSLPVDVGEASKKVLGR
jgi:hypothetical protein